MGSSQALLTEGRVIFPGSPRLLTTLNFLNNHREGGGGAMVLAKLPVQGRPTNVDSSRACAYCACGWDCFGHFSLVYHFFFLSPSLWQTARYRLKYCLKGPLSPIQPTNQPTNRPTIPRYKRVPQFSFPAETVRHIWLPPRLSAISCFLPRLLCSGNSFLQRLSV